MINRVRDEKDEHATVRGMQAAAEGDAEGARDRRTDDQCRDDAQRIFCGKGDRAFGNEGQAEDTGSFAGFAFFDGEAVFEEQRRAEDGERRGHTGGHGCSHGEEDVAADEGGGDGVGGFVHRAAHVERHHAAEQAAEEEGSETFGVLLGFQPGS